MIQNRSLTRRTWLTWAGGIGLTTVLGTRSVGGRAQENDTLPESVAWIRDLPDVEIRRGLEAAIVQNLLPAATQRHYPGHFTISADGAAFGTDTTWPGLDSWQMTGAYLLLGRTQLVLDYFEFVRASQREDGNIPFAIFSGETRSEGKYLRGLKYPEDAFTYNPPQRAGLPASSQQPRTWMRLFEHWQPKANPLSTLAAVCYILTAAEIFDATGSQAWLEPRLASIAAAATYLLNRKGENGLIGGSGFYMEMPPRYGNDGVTQCYVIHAFGELARLYRAVGDAEAEAR